MAAGRSKQGGQRGSGSRAAGKGGANAGVLGWDLAILAGPLEARYTGGMDTPGKRRRFFPTPAWLVLGSLAATGLLFLSERWRWFPFNEHKGWTVLIAVAVVGGAMLVMLGWFIVALVFRWRFQFSIRSLLVLVVVVALPCSWLAVEMKKAKKQKAAVEAIVELKASVYYDYLNDANFRDPRPLGPAWLQSLLGVDFFARVDRVFFYGSRVTDADLEHLTALNELQLLSFAKTAVTDAGLENLKDANELHDLILVSTDITDVGLEHLKGLRTLRTLDIRHTQVTNEGVKKLQQALPNCKIER